MKILFIADVVGQPGRETLCKRFPEIKEKEKPDFIIANAENAAGGKGLTGPTAREIFGCGIDVITLGNHAFDRKEIEEVINNPKILRPANYPPNVQGKGYGVYHLDGKGKIAVINIMGRIYLPNIDCPFRGINDILEIIKKETKVIIVDFHAEVTSEKNAMGWYLDGRVSAVIGTHTHIPTADEKILPLGTAYITDVGMTGPVEGVIGMDKEIVLKKFLTGLPHPFVVAKGQTVMQGCVVEIDENSGKAQSIRRFSIQG
ncbi:MAG: TIGR00282 family metallophosphoesterase [Elusimicrobia bacterium]|nr:TIGR00282 family metallophosphoesterase [Elusimicrobiota bacterium]